MACRRWVVFACALLASGCFRWAPITSLSSIEDDRVLVHEGNATQTLVHATARGHVIEGQAREGGERVEVDATESRVLARRLNVPATAAILGASAVAIAGTVFAVGLFTFLLAQQPIPEQGGQR